ncbi:MAG: MATE family efflux transporter [Alphaproteobacteria bacterium]|nr:MATE family efflux transporter [Alphaproteobacteria bacterium]
MNPSRQYALVPFVLGRAGLLLFLVVDTAVIAGHGPGPMAALGVAYSLQTLFMMVALTLLQGGLVLASAAVGAGDPAGLRRASRTTLALGFGLGIVLLLLAGVAEPLFRLTGQSPDAAAAGAAVFAAYGWGMPGLTLFLAIAYLHEARGQVWPPVIVLYAGILANAALSPLALAQGSGFGPGPAITTVAVSSGLRWAMMLVLLALLARTMAAERRVPIREDAGAGGGAGTGGPRALLRLALPLALLQGIETLGFSGMVVLAARLGPEAAAAHHVSTQTLQIAYMAAIGIAARTAVRVAQAAGAGRPGEAGRHALAGARASLALTLPLAALLLAFPGTLAGLVLDDPQARALAVVTLRVTALIIVFDALMAIGLGALRGLKDVWLPVGVHLLAFGCVGLPLAAALGLGTGLGVAGISCGILLAVVLATAGAFARLRWLTRGR